MEKLRPLIRLALQQAKLHGYLIVRTDRLYHPGASNPVCSIHIAGEMIRAGLLVEREGRYEITAVGKLAAEDRPT